jgi:hypothetical protein
MQSANVQCCCVPNIDRRADGDDSPKWTRSVWRNLDVKRQMRPRCKFHHDSFGCCDTIFYMIKDDINARAGSVMNSASSVKASWLS